MDTSTQQNFGLYLKELRVAAGLSLRDVEGQAGGAISNAYLSQIESGKITQPSPHILMALAQVYRVSDRDLMEEAGYIRRRDPKKKRSSPIAMMCKRDLTDDEREQMIKFLEFLRAKNKPS